MPVTLLKLAFVQAVYFSIGPGYPTKAKYFDSKFTTVSTINLKVQSD